MADNGNVWNQRDVGGSTGAGCHKTTLRNGFRAAPFQPQSILGECRLPHYRSSGSSTCVPV